MPKPSLQVFVHLDQPLAGLALGQMPSGFLQLCMPLNVHTLARAFRKAFNLIKVKMVSSQVLPFLVLIQRLSRRNSFGVRLGALLLAMLIQFLPQEPR